MYTHDFEIVRNPKVSVFIATKAWQTKKKQFHTEFQARGAAGCLLVGNKTIANYA